MAAFRAHACDYRREGILNDSRFDLLPLELQLANAITPPECVHLRQRLGADDGQVQTSLGGHLATASTPNQQGMRVDDDISMLWTCNFWGKLSNFFSVNRRAFPSL